MKYLMILALFLLAVETSPVQKRLTEKRDTEVIEVKKRLGLYPRNEQLNREKERILEKRGENAEDIEHEKRQSWRLKNKWIHLGLKKVLEKRDVIDQ